MEICDFGFTALDSTLWSTDSLQHSQCKSWQLGHLWCEESSCTTITCNASRAGLAVSSGATSAHFYYAKEREVRACYLIFRLPVHPKILLDTYIFYFNHHALYYYQTSLMNSGSSINQNSDFSKLFFVYTSAANHNECSHNYRGKKTWHLKWQSEHSLSYNQLIAKPLHGIN